MAEAAPATVLSILQCSNLGGMEQLAYELFEGLSMEAAMRFRIFSPRPLGPGAPRLKSVDPEVKGFPYRGKFGWRDWGDLQRYAEKQVESCDSVWVTGTSAAALAAIRGIRGKKKILGHHYHHFEKPWSPLQWRGFYAVLARQLDVITYPVDFTRNEALRICPWLKERAHVVRYGFSLHYQDEAERETRRLEARKANDLPEDAFIIGNGGWFIPRKRFDVFLETAALIHKERPEAFFEICGGGPLEDALKAQARRLGLETACRFTGWVDNMHAHYPAWDVCLFNSDFDALGRTPVEAATHGCIPAASVTYGGLGEFLVDGENGVFMTDHDPARLARAIIDLTGNHSLCTEFREANRLRFESAFSFAHSLEVYHSLLRA